MSKIKGLKYILEGFQGANNEADLTQIFKDTLAPSFLYGGYISVSDCQEERYRIYIRTVEFYFHSEKVNGIKDPIVYHRNGRYVKGDVPYFQIMSLHAHTSGIDITFENSTEKYRASALIRAYEVYDVKQKAYLVSNKEVFETTETPIINDQSTYIYNFINGFGVNNINWIDSNRIKISEIKQPLKGRQNVFIYKNNDVSQKTDIKDERQWCFRREDELGF